MIGRLRPGLSRRTGRRRPDAGDAAGDARGMAAGARDRDTRHERRHEPHARRCVDAARRTWWTGADGLAPALRATPARPDGLCGARAAHRLRQHREPAALARRGPAEGDRNAPGARCRPRATRAPVVHGEPADCRPRRRGRPRAGALGGECPGRLATVGRICRARGRARLARLRLLRRHGVVHGRAVRPRTRDARRAHGTGPGDQAHDRRGVGASCACPGRGAGRPVARPARGRGPLRRHAQEPARRGQGLQCRPPADLPRPAATERLRAAGDRRAVHPHDRAHRGHSRRARRDAVTPSTPRAQPPRRRCDDRGRRQDRRCRRRSERRRAELLRHDGDSAARSGARSTSATTRMRRRSPW